MKKTFVKILAVFAAAMIALATLPGCSFINFFEIEDWLNDIMEPAQTQRAENTPKPDAGDSSSVPATDTNTEFRRNSTDDTYTAVEIYRDNVDSVVGIRSESTSKNIFGQTSTTASLGTGIILTTDGYILTNNHIIEDGKTFKVTLYNGETYEATIVGAEKTNDVAVLKINANGLNAAGFGDSDKMVVGEDVIVIGNPLGELTFSLSRGVVSARNRAINEDGTPINVFQIDAAVNEGNSGGPAFDAHGNVIGMVTAKVNSSLVEGIGFCIPANDALSIASQLIDYGYVKGKGALGIAATSAYRESFWGTSRVSGAYVNYIVPGGAAEKAGLEKGMLITAVDSTEITSPDDLAVVIRGKPAGTTVKLTGIYSDNRSFEVSVTLGEYTPDMTPEGWKANDGIIM